MQVAPCIADPRLAWAPRAVLCSARAALGTSPHAMLRSNQREKSRAPSNCRSSSAWLPASAALVDSTRSSCRPGWTGQHDTSAGRNTFERATAQFMQLTMHGSDCCWLLTTPSNATHQALSVPKLLSERRQLARGLAAAPLQLSSASCGEVRPGAARRAVVSIFALLRLAALLAAAAGSQRCRHGGHLLVQRTVLQVQAGACINEVRCDVYGLPLTVTQLADVGQVKQATDQQQRMSKTSPSWVRGRRWAHGAGNPNAHAPGELFALCHSSLKVTYLQAGIEQVEQPLMHQPRHTLRAAPHGTEEEQWLDGATRGTFTAGEAFGQSGWSILRTSRHSWAHRMCGVCAGQAGMW